MTASAPGRNSRSASRVSEARKRRPPSAVAREPSAAAAAVPARTSPYTATPIARAPRWGQEEDDHHDPPDRVDEGPSRETPPGRRGIPGAGVDGAARARVAESAGEEGDVEQVGEAEADQHGREFCPEEREEQARAVAEPREREREQQEGGRAPGSPDGRGGPRIRGGGECGNDGDDGRERERERGHDRELGGGDERCGADHQRHEMRGEDDEIEAESPPVRACAARLGWGRG